MSVDITFQKEFTIEDVENKTSIKIEYKNRNYWMVKNGSCILINSYVSTEEDIKNYKDKGYIITNENDYIIASNEEERIIIRLDNGKKNLVDGLTSYGLNSIGEILDEIVITFQTKFMTDEEEHKLYFNESLDPDTVFDEATRLYGYNIDDNGIITKNIITNDIYRSNN